jgi:hypothetical protein
VALQARYWHLGDQISAGTTFINKTAARAWLSSVETDLKRGDHVDPRAGTERFGPYARRWLGERDLRPRTRDSYESQLAWITATFEAVRLPNIGPSGVRSWHGRMHKTGLSANTVAKVYPLFRTIMSTAVEDGLLRTNPIAIKGAAADEHHERPTLSYDDVRRLAAAIELRFRALILTAATSGLRYSELTGLSRAHVDLARSTTRVERALSFVRGVVTSLGPPKTRRRIARSRFRGGPASRPRGAGAADNGTAEDDQGEQVVAPSDPEHQPGCRSQRHDERTDELNRRADRRPARRSPPPGRERQMPAQPADSR